MATTTASQMMEMGVSFLSDSKSRCALDCFQNALQLGVQQEPVAADTPNAAAAEATMKVVLIPVEIPLFRQDEDTRSFFICNQAFSLHQHEHLRQPTEAMEEGAETRLSVADANTASSAVALFNLALTCHAMAYPYDQDSSYIRLHQAHVFYSTCIRLLVGMREAQAQPNNSFRFGNAVRLAAMNNLAHLQVLGGQKTDALELMRELAPVLTNPILVPTLCLPKNILEEISLNILLLTTLSNATASSA